MQQIGFVGLGAMGSVMAPLPAGAGFSVIGFDTAPQRPDLADVTNALSLTDMVACETIITMLPDGAAVSAVAIALAKAGFRGLIIDMSSSHPDDTISLGATLAAQGVLRDAARVAALQQDGLLSPQKDVLQATEKGRLLLDYIIARLLA